MKFIYLSAALIAPAALAAGPAAPPARPYSFRGEKVEFTEIREMLVSKNCAARPAKCEALKNLEKLSAEEIQRRYPATQATGSRLCEDILVGRVVLGESPLGDENAFCRFSRDKTMVELGSLVARAQENDKAAAAKGNSPAKAAEPKAK